MFEKDIQKKHELGVRGINDCLQIGRDVSILDILIVDTTLTFLYKIIKQINSQPNECMTVVELIPMIQNALEDAQGFLNHIQTLLKRQYLRKIIKKTTHYGEIKVKYFVQTMSDSLISHYIRTPI